MNQITLPPKRFEAIEDPRFDQIRGKPWFWRLKERRTRLHSFQQAYQAWDSRKFTQLQASLEYGIHERDLRDYISFVRKHPATKKIDRTTAQRVLDDAYVLYCEDNANKNFVEYVQAVAYRFGINPRMARELWEVDSTFYPSAYNNKR